MAEGNSSQHSFGMSEEDKEYFKSKPRLMAEDESDNEETGHQPLQTSNVSPPRNPRLMAEDESDNEETGHQPLQTSNVSPPRNPRLMAEDESDNEETGHQPLQTSNVSPPRKETTAKSKKPSGISAQFPVERSNLPLLRFWEYVDITFFLYCESKKKVDLIIRDINIKTEIQMRSCGGGIYSASANLSLSGCQNGEITYRYRRRSQPILVSQLFTGNTQVEIEDCDHKLEEFIRGIPVRDYWKVFNVLDETPKVGFKAHCLHIFREMSHTSIITEVTTDLNQTIKKFIANSQQHHPLPDSEINSLVSSVLSMSLMSYHYICLLALLSSIGFQHVEKILNKKQSQVIIDNVRESRQHVTSMFEPYREGMPQLLYDICKIQHSKDMSVLKLIEKVYPFLDVKEFLSFDDHIFPFYERQSMEITEVSDIIRIFTADREFTLDCRRLIEAVIKQLNFNELQELSRSLPEVKVIQEHFRTRCEIKVSKVKDLQELYESCQSIDKCCYKIVQEEVKEKLQACMGNADFSHTTINNLTILKFFCHTFFRNFSPNPIVELLDLYPDNKDHLLKLLDHSMFSEKQEYCREAVEWWIEKRLVAFKENIDMIDQIYSWLETISKLPAFKKGGCVSLEYKVFKVVKSFTFWEVFPVALQQEARSKLFENHVRKVLETQKPTIFRMEDLHVNVMNRVKKFDGRAQDLDRFDGSLLVCLLDLMRPHLPTDGMQVVLAIMDDATFWKSVVQSNGKGMDLVKKHKVYEIVTSSFEALMDCLKTNKFDYKFALTMNETTNRDNLVQLMKHFTSCDTGTMMSHITQAFDRMFTMRNSLKDTSEMLQNLERMLPEDHLEYFSDTLTGLMTSIKQQLSTKQNLVTYYDSEFLYTHKAMKENYDLVKGTLTSEFFWKVNENQRDRMSRLVMPLNNLTAVEGVLQTLARDFLTKYKHDWEDLQQCSSLQIKDVQGLFSGRNIDQEIEIMSKHSLCLYDASRKTIFRHFFKFQEYSNKIKSLDSTAEVVVFVYPALLPVNRCNSVKQVQEKVQTMIDSGNGVLWDMGTDLQIIEEFASKVTDDIQEVLTLIQESTELLQFLKEIKADDIIHLSDSLEKYSEEIVRKSTLISLMDVEKVFRVLTETTNWKPGKELEIILLDILKKQNLKDLAGKLDECIANTHSLKNLHGEHSSISSRIEDTINNILTNGYISFRFIDQKYAIFVEMVDHGRTFQEKFKTKHSPVVKRYRLDESELEDLQSRAQLIYNTEDTNVRTKLNDFVEIIDTGLKVVEVLMELRELGHYKYKNYQSQTRCSGEDVKILLDILTVDTESWKESVKNIRKRYTCLNYVHSSQLATLYEYFIEGQRNQNAKSILQFVNPTDGKLRKEEKVVGLNSDTSMLEHIAKHLQEIERCEPMEGVQLQKTRTIRQSWSSSRLGQKNFIITKLKENSKDSFNVMFALCMEKSRVFPRADQVIICTPETTWQDVELMLRRLCQSKAEELYCIVNGDLLCDKTLRQLSEEVNGLSFDSKNMLAVIFRGYESNAFLERHSDAIQQVEPLSIPEMKNRIQNAWPFVFLVTSTCSGLGKTEYIRQENRKDPNQNNIVRLHISSIFNAISIIKRLQKLRISEKTLLHIDVGMIDAPEELDKFLFELIVFRYVRRGYHSAFLFTRHIAIEVANTINNTLIDKLMLLSNFNTIDLRWKGFDKYVVSQEVNSPIQLVCHCLNDDPDKSDQRAQKPLSQERCRKILSDTFENDIWMSYTKLKVFLAVFAAQLRNMTTSEFFQSRHIKEDYGTDSNKVQQVRSSMVKLMQEISKTISCRSVESSKSSQSLAHTLRNATCLLDDNDEDEDNEYDEGSSKDIIRWEDFNHIIVAFHQDNTTLSLFYKDLEREPDYVRIIKKFVELHVQSNVKPLKDMGQEGLKKILWRIVCQQEMSESKYREALKNYVLTPDNVLKFALILLRLRAGIPVVLIGDTGCGKTSLIKVLAEICGVQYKILHIHAGVTEKYILGTILDLNRRAKEKFCQEFWLFIDEVNTNEHVGLLGDVLCHHVCFEHILAPNLSIMAACNPYRYHQVIKTRNNIGLRRGFSNKMSHLVYHVHPLPESLLSSVWDFGTLGKQDEKEYIKEMLKVCKQQLDADELTLFTDSVLKSQQFVRKSEHTEYSVSLRDVERCRYLLEWFVETYFVKKYGSKGSKNKEAIVLTLNICYRIRFQSHTIRKKYIEALKKIGNFAMDFEAVVHHEQVDIVKRMQLPPGIAVTNTLSENIFTMMVCALTNIPLFVVGKPGCSKTLSVQLLRSNLRGDDSRDNFFRELPCVFSVTYLGTKSSTSESIEKAFQKALQYQTQHNVKALLILDEIGQAERSDYNPLKVLHTLLEGNGVHADVAVIGISNWQLDAAKMNRAIYLARPDMEEKELALVATSIYTSITSHVTENRTKPPDWIEKIVKAYKEYSKNQTRSDFHGLRDFYYLVRYISERVGRRLLQIDHKVIANGVLRNFSGLLPMDSRAFVYFKRGFDLDVNENQDLVLERIRANIRDKNSRHLMLISHSDASITTILNLLQELNRDYVQLFGSTLPNDQSKEYEHRILSKIVLCMEKGEVVVLKNLPNIYGNLYDMLNQSYCVVGGKRHCRVALSADYFPMCCVHEDFKCITVVDRDDLRNIETPFLNRFEKQQMSLEEMLTDTNKKALGILEKHLGMSLELEKDKKLDDRKLMPIQGKDSLSSLISYSTDTCPVYNDNPNDIWQICIKDYLPEVFHPEIVTTLTQSKAWKEEQPLVERIQEAYWKKQIHKGLNYFLEENKENDKSLFLVFTHSTVNAQIKDALLAENTEIANINSVASEKKLMSIIQRFEEGVLVIQFPPEVPAESITFVKAMVEKEKYRENGSGDGQIVLLVYLDRCCDQKLLNRIEFSKKWEIVTLDSLLEPFRPLPDMVGKSTVKVLENMESYFLTKETLYWAFSRIYYVDDDEESEKAMGRIEKILKRLEDYIVRKHFWNCIITWLQSNEKELTKSDKWLLELARKTFVKENVGSFIGVIEKYFVESIRNPLAVLIYQLEKNHALQYLVNDDKYLVYVDKNNENTRRSKKEVWCDLLDKQNLLLENTYIKPSGPGCYKIHHKNIEYKVPFGICIIEKVERFKEEFLAGLEYDYSDAEQCKIHQSELVAKLRKDIRQFEHFLQYEGFEEDYLDDFKTYISSIKLSSLQDKTTINIPLWVKKIFTLDEPRDTLETIVSLHTTFWMHSLTINELLKLLNLSESVGLRHIDQIIQDVNETDDSESTCEMYPKLYSIAQLLCEEIFPSSKKGRKLDHEFIRWQQTAYALRSVSEKLISEPPCFITLKFFLELATVVDEGADFTFGTLAELGYKITSAESVLDIDSPLVEMELKRTLQKISDKNCVDFIRSCYFSKYLVLNDDPTTLADVLDKIKPSLPGCKFLGSFLRHLLENIDFSELLNPFDDVASIQECIARNHVLRALQNLFCNHIETINFALIIGDILETFVVQFDEEFPSNEDILLVKTISRNIVLLQGNDEDECTLLNLIFFAFLKRFVSLFVDLMNDRRTIDKAVIECVNGILKHGGQLSKEGMFAMEMYFLQQLEAGKGLLNLEAKCMETKFKDLEVCKAFALEPGTPACLLDLTVERLCGHERYKVCQIMISSISSSEHNSRGTRGEFDSLGVLAYSLSNFYLRQCLHDGTDLDLAKLVSELPTKLDVAKDGFYLQILKVLTLQDDSRLHLYHLSKESPPCDVYLAAFAVFFLSILSENQNGFWMALVKDPQKLCSKTQASVKTETTVSYYNCDCGQRFTHQNVNGTPAECPQGHVRAEHDSIQDNTPCYQTKFSDKVLHLLHGSNKLLFVSPLSQQLLRLLVSVCLACGFGFDKCRKQIAVILNVQEHNLYEELEKQLKENWKCISNCLSVGHCELYHILTIFVDEYREDIFNEDNEDSWILKFQEGVQSVIRENRFVISESALLEKQGNISVKEASNIRFLLNEDCTTERMRIPYLRKTSKASIDSLTTELWLSGEKEHFPFLCLVLEKHNDFGMLKFMATLIKWHLSTVNLFSYKLKNSDCALPFDKFLSRQTDKFRNRVEKELEPDEFRSKWNSLVKHCRETLNMNIGLNVLHRHSTVEEYMNLDQESQVQKATDTMVSIQNRFLDEAMSICAEKTSCKSLGLLRYGERKAAVPISPLVKVTSDMIIDFDLSDNDLSDKYLRFSQNNTSIGCGRHVEYNYRKIEFDLAQDILTGKAHLRHTHKSLPKIQFKDDVFKNTMHLIKQIKVDQEPIPSEISIFIRENKVDRQELLTLSEVLLAHINHMGTTNEAASSLQQYMEERKNVFGENDYDSLIPNKGFMKLQLCHVVALYRLMEELNGELVLEAKQELYGKELEKYIIQAMYKIDSDFLKVFLSAIRTFAFRCLQDDNDVDKSMMLRDKSCLEDKTFWPDNTLENEQVSVRGRSVPLYYILDAEFFVKNLWSIHQRILEMLKNPGGKTALQRKTPQKKSTCPPTGSEVKRNKKKPNV